MKTKIVLLFFVFAFFLAPDAMADSACNGGNYSKTNTIYLSPSAGENNQTQINNAIASAPSGGSVFLKSGTYVISQPIKLKSNIVLEGDKDAVIRLKDMANWKAEFISSASGSRQSALLEGGSGLSNVEIKCFTIDGNYNFSGGNQSGASCWKSLKWNSDFSSCESQSGGGRYHGRGYYTMINFSNASNLSVHDMTLQDGCNDGLRVISSSNVRFYNNFVNAMGHEGIYAITSSGIEVYGNRIAARASDGVRGDDCHDYSIHDNEIYSYNGKDSSAGVQIDNKKGTSIYNIQIFRNVFHDIWNGGIWLSVGNMGMHEGKYPVEIHHNLFVGNGYSRNSAVGPTGGIISSAGIASIIYNNTFDGNYGSGIYDSGGKAKIISNIITGTRPGKYSGAGAGSGIQGGAEVSYNVFYDNAGGDYTKGGEGNYSGNPLYHETRKDYHLQSKAGRWDPDLGQWVADSANSLAIDAGIPFSVSSVYGEYANEPKENGARLNAGVYGNTSQASLSGNVRQEIMPPAPVADIFATVYFEPGGSGEFSGYAYVPGSSTGTAGPGSFVGDGTGAGFYGEAGEKYDGPVYYDPKSAVLEASASQDVIPAGVFVAAELAPIFPELAPAADTATAECSVSQEKGGLIPCGRNTDDPSTSWNECRKCDLCSIVLMLQLTIEFLLKMAGIVATLAIVAAGSLYMLAAGKAEHINRAKDMVKYTLIGFAVVFTAWIVVNSVLAILGYIDPLGGDWYTVC
jgi:hypothetical protein